MPIVVMSSRPSPKSAERACPERSRKGGAPCTRTLVPFNLLEYPAQAISPYRIDHFDKIYVSLQM
jgi:hypothetical protein